jgi:hypothetical protein
LAKHFEVLGVCHLVERTAFRSGRLETFATGLGRVIRHRHHHDVSHLVDPIPEPQAMIPHLAHVHGRRNAARLVA